MFVAFYAKTFVAFYARSFVEFYAKTFVAWPKKTDISNIVFKYLKFIFNIIKFKCK